MIKNLQINSVTFVQDNTDGLTFVNITLMMCTSEPYGWSPMSSKDDVRFLIEIAQMYYGEEATQDDVAKRFNISRSLVSRYLSRARDLGIVEIRVNDELYHPYKLIEDKIRQRFNLSAVICVNVTEPSLLKQQLGDAAAQYLSKVITPNSIVGVSAGSTALEVAHMMHYHQQSPELTFIPFVGGLAKEHAHIQSNVICDIFAQRTGGRSLNLHVPVIADTVTAKDVLLSQNFIRRTFDQMKRVEIALVGIGGAPVYEEMTQLYLDKVDETSFIDKEKVVGDICYNFIDKNGRFVDIDWNRRVMAVPLVEIKSIPHVIGVAGGEHKVEGIRAALKGNYLDVLVTDNRSARALLEEG